MRALGQSLAREFGPKGVHVAHAVIDGGIDIPRLKDVQINGGGPDSKISPDAVRIPSPCPDNLSLDSDRMQIADSYWYLHTQPRSHFTQELDIRPYIEKF